MSFLKKHYEKIIFTFLLVVFVILLVVQISILLEGRNVDPRDLKLPKKDPDYQRVNFKDQQKYGVIETLSVNDKWSQAAPRQEGDKVFTDICAPIDLAKCPYCSHLVPLGDFKAGKCSYCAHALPPPQTGPLPPDGISDDLLKKYGIVRSDLDLDPMNIGFTNKERIEAKLDYNGKTDFNLKNPKNRPSYATKLSVVEIVRKKLNMKIAKIINKSEDKAQWEVHIQILEGGKERTRFPKIGGIVKSDDGEYKILDIISQFKTELDPTVKSSVERNYSKVVLQRIGGGEDEKIYAESGKDIMESKEKIILFYSITNKNIELYVGDSVTLGNEVTGEEKFTVLDCDPARMTVNLKLDDGKGKVYEIQQSRQPVEKPADRPAPFMPPPAAGGAPRPGGMPPGMGMPPIMPPRP